MNIKREIRKRERWTWNEMNEKLRLMATANVAIKENDPDHKAELLKRIERCDENMTRWLREIRELKGGCYSPPCYD